jgi:hypothetical protein
MAGSARHASDGSGSRADNETVGGGAVAGGTAGERLGDRDAAVGFVAHRFRDAVAEFVARQSQV